VSTRSTYKVKRIDEKEAKNIFNTFKTRGWTSYVGYESTAKYMEKVLGEYIPVNRDTAKLEPKDVILVCKLPYRVNPNIRRTPIQTNKTSNGGSCNTMSNSSTLLFFFRFWSMGVL